MAIIGTISENEVKGTLSEKFVMGVLTEGVLGSIFGDAILDNISPVVSKIEMIANNIIDITFNENLADIVPDNVDFTVLFDDAEIEKSLTLNGAVIRLTLASSASYGQVITVAYTPGENVLQDAEGNKVIAFSEEVDNIAEPPNDPVVESISIEDLTPTNIEILFDLNLDETSIPDIGDFTVLINSSEYSVSNVTVSGKKVILTVPRVYYGDTGTLAYSKGSNPVKSLIGGELESFSATSINNNCALDAATITLIAEGRYTNAPSDAIKALINKTIIKLKSYNGIQKSDGCWFFGNYEALLSCQNWAKNDHNAILLNNPTHVPGSHLKGDGLSQSINLDYIPSTDAVNFQLGSECVIVMCPVLGTTNNRNVFGVQKTAAPISVLVFAFRTAATEYMYINSDGTANDNVNMTAGKYMAYIRANTSVQGYIDGEASGAADTVNQATLPAYTVRALCSGSNNTPANFFDGGIGFLWLGGGINATQMSGIVQTAKDFYTELAALI